MDASKLRQAIDAVHVELNALIDVEWKARRMSMLSALTKAANALQKAETHIEEAVAKSGGCSL